MNDKKFDKIVRSKIWREPSDNLDKIFYKELDRRFETKSNTIGIHFRGLKAALAVCSVCFLVVFSIYKTGLEKDQKIADISLNEMIEMEVALDRMDEFREIEDINMPEDEWNILLGEET